MRTLTLTTMFALAAGTTLAQTGPNGFPRQTAMSALGQAGVLTRAPQPTPYRVAARAGYGAQATPPARAVKPFSGASAAPTISPYLNLFRDEVALGAPNYHTFVRPQQDQYEALRAQQAQMLQLQNQVQQASYQRVPSGVAGGARYGDTGQFYGGWRR